MAKGERWIAGGRLALSGEVALRISGGRIDEVRSSAPKDAERIDLRGHWIAPFASDAHVHFAFAAGLGASDASNRSKVDEGLSKVSRAMLAGGVSGAVDLGAPQALVPALASMRADANFSLAFSGPLLCAPRGYPTQSWGADGYGLELSQPDDARAAVRALHQAGATFAKLGLDTRYPLLNRDVARAIVLEARELKMRSAAHALDSISVRAALDAEVDILAHTPIEKLPDDLIAQAGARKLAVISTLVAFGSEESARENLARLIAAGCTALYGTDLGNQGTSPGLSESELRALNECGLSCAQILFACTQGAADFLGDKSRGRLEVGSPAHLLVLAEDPMRDPTALCRPAQRFVAGVKQTAAAAREEN